MNDIEHHCPFLDQADPRCSRSLSLQRLDEAFAHCFAEFDVCGVFAELRAERRRQRARTSPPRQIQHAGPTLVQVTIARRHPKSLSLVEAVPDLSGVGAGAGR